MNKIRIFFVDLYISYLTYKLEKRNLPLEVGTRVLVLPRRSVENSDYSLRKVGGLLYHRGVVLGFKEGRVDVQWTHLTVSGGHPHKLFNIKRIMRVDTLNVAIELRELELTRIKLINESLLKKREYGNN